MQILEFFSIFRYNYLYKDTIPPSRTDSIRIYKEDEERLIDEKMFVQPKCIYIFKSMCYNK